MRICLTVIMWALLICDVWCQNPCADSVCVAKGDSCAQQYDMLGAITHYKRSGREDADVARKIAECYRKVGNCKSCISWLQKIDSANVSHADMRTFYYSYKSLGEKDSTLYWGTKITNQFPYDAEIIASLSAYFNDSNNPAKADSLARAYCRLDTTNVLVNRQLGYACYALKKYDEALNIYTALIDNGFDNYESNYITGVCSEQMDSLELAYKHLAKAVECSGGKDFNSLYQLGVLCLNMGAADESLEYFRKAENVIRPDKRTMFNLYKNLGASNFKLQRYEDAGRAFEDCLNYYPEDALTYYNAAQMFYAAGETEKAKEYLSKFIAISEQDSDASENTHQLIDNAKQQMLKW